MMPEMVIQDFPYEPEYWTQFPMKNDMDFVEGATLPIYRSFDDEGVQLLLQIFKEKMPIMKNEILKLTWEKIRPLQ